MSAARIDRGFVRILPGQVHYRTAGAVMPGGRPPLLIAHGGPGSSLGVAPILADLGRDRRVVAPDMMGNGDSDPPPTTDMSIADYIDHALQVIDALDLERVDLYGDHTGANIVCELAIRHPARVRRVVLDGVALWTPELRAELLARYAPPVVPDEFGGHLAWAWHFVTELFWHFPYFDRDPAHRNVTGAVPSPAIRQRLAGELIKALSTYHIAYKAAFEYPTAERLPLLTAKTAILAVASDPLSRYAAGCAALTPQARLLEVARDEKSAALRAFLDSPLDATS